MFTCDGLTGEALSTCYSDLHITLVLCVALVALAATVVLGIKFFHK